jgi:L-alanine-DL-glutamate epimerase-like enolase superfamily enzyme
MKITALETYFLSAPLPQPVRTSTSTILESFADPSRDPLWFELFRERPKIVDGFMAVPDAPGLGLDLREDTLEKYGVELG